MSENELSQGELLRQATKHLQSLRDGGVEWLPLGEPVERANSPEKLAPAPVETESPPVESEKLFVPELPPEIPAEQRKVELELLAEQVAGCSRCSELYSSRTQTVFGDGRLDAELCFIGEAPGRDEDEQGVPFVGRAGQLLNRIIEACGFRREEVYICNILKCRPPANRTPSLTEAENCREYLDKQLALVRPKYICALGACAAQNLLGTTTSIGQLRKRFHDYDGVPVLCTYHPAFLLRNPERKRDVWDDMKMLLRRMGRPIPETKKQST